MKHFWKFAIVFVAATSLLSGCHYAHEASEVTWQETRPKELLRKYRWFKELAAQIDAKQADIVAKKKTLARLETRVAKTTNERIAENLADEQNLQEQEIYGLIASFNQLAAEYNRRMADIGYQFCNSGQMPQGLEGETALRRSYAVYKTE